MEKENNKSGSEINFEKESKFSMKSVFDLSQITNTETSILITKTSKTQKDEFLCVNSDFSCSYFRIKESEIYLLNSYREHSGRINDITFFDETQNPFENCFITASSDNTMKLWDYRTKKSVQTLKSHTNLEYWSVSTCKDYLVSGCGREIQYRDLKKLEKIKIKKNSHSADVTSVNLKEVDDKTYLLSGSEDNIINLYDITQKDNFCKEFPVVIYNVNNPVQNCGFLDNENKFIEMISTQNTYHVFNENCCEILQFNAISEEFKTDYVISTIYTPETQKIELFCGSYYGDLVLLSLYLNVKKPIVTFESRVKTDFQQIINGMTKLNDKLFLASSDIGHLYLFEEKVQLENLIEGEPLDEINEQKSKSKNKKKGFTPY